MTHESFTFSHPSSHGLCGCGLSNDITVSAIARSTDWPVSFPLQSTVEYVSATGLQLETIVSRLKIKLGGRLAHSEDSYRRIGAQESCLDIIRRGCKPSWVKKAPRQRIAPSNPVISDKADKVLDIEVLDFLRKALPMR